MPILANFATLAAQGPAALTTVWNLIGTILPSNVSILKQKKRT